MSDDWPKQNAFGFDGWGCKPCQIQTTGYASHEKAQEAYMEHLRDVHFTCSECGAQSDSGAEFWRHISSHPQRIVSAPTATAELERLSAALGQVERLLVDLGKARAVSDSYLELIHQAISHHIEAHPECGHYRTAR